MQIADKINQKVLAKWVINDGTVWGVRKDCPVKVAYKLQQRVAMTKILWSEVGKIIDGNKSLSEIEIETKINEFIDGYQ